MEQQIYHIGDTNKMGMYNFYPIWISSEIYKKLLCIQTKPELNIWYKDEEITQEQLIEILSK